MPSYYSMIEILSLRNLPVQRQEFSNFAYFACRILDFPVSVCDNIHHIIPDLIEMQTYQ